MSGYLKTFKVKDGDKNWNNKSMYFCITDNSLLEKYKIICTKIEDLKSIRLIVLPVYDDKYIKIEKRTYGDKVYTNFRSLNIPEDYFYLFFTSLQ